MSDPFRPEPNPFDITQCQYTAYRDSRDAFGSRFQVTKPSHDWLWGLGLSICAALLLVAWFAYRTN